MTDDQASRWSWATTLLCAAYVTWVCYVMDSRIPALMQLYAGLPARELPRVTILVSELADGPVYIFGAALILGLVLKEAFLKKLVIRFSITMIVFMIVAWFCDFAIDAMLRPLSEVLERIG